MGLFGATWVGGIDSESSLQDLPFITATTKAALPTVKGTKNNHFDLNEISPFVKPTSGKNPKGVHVVNPMILMIKVIVASRAAHIECRGRPKQANRRAATETVKVTSKQSTASMVFVVMCAVSPNDPPLIHSPTTESQLGRNQGCRNGARVKNSEAKGCWIKWAC